MGVSTDEANDVFLALLRVQKLLMAARTTAPRVHDAVDSTTYPLLFVIASAGSARVSDIATTLHNDISTVSRQVSTLVTHGLVAKTPDPKDGRAQVVSITEAGHDVLGLLKASRSRWFQGLLEDWEGADAAAFTSLLRRLGDALDESLRARGATPPLFPHH